MLYSKLMEKIHIVDKVALDWKIDQFKKAGAKGFHIVSDFDSTLTLGFENGKKLSTSFGQIRDGGYMSEEYVKKAYELLNYYYPIETDPKIPLNEKCIKMEEWWEKHMELMVEMKLSKTILKDIADKDNLCEGKFVPEILELLKNKSIPLLIFSAGLGDVIKEFMLRKNQLSDNIHIISNFYNFDDKGYVTGYKSKAIHVFNKNEVEIQDSPYHKEIQERKNVILLGDSLGDLGMAEGMNHDCIIKIGFLNHKEDELLEEYSKHYDVIILGDGTMQYVLNLLKKIIN